MTFQEFAFRHFPSVLVFVPTVIKYANLTDLQNLKDLPPQEEFLVLSFKRIVSLHLRNVKILLKTGDCLKL